MDISLLSVGPPYRGGISEQTYYLYKNLSINNEVELINFNRQYPKFLFPGKNQYDDESKFQIKRNHAHASPIKKNSLYHDVFQKRNVSLDHQKVSQ